MELQAQGQNDLFDELLALFRADGAAQLAELQEAMTRGEVGRAGRIAHTLRGEALAWGAATLAQRCQEIEHDANATNSNGHGGSRPSVDDLGELFKSTVAALEAIRANSRC